MSYNKNYKYVTKVEEILRSTFKFTKFDIESIIDTNYIYTSNHYSLGFNIDTEKVMKLTRKKVNSFRIEFEFYKSSQNPTDYIINIIFRSAFKSIISDFLINANKEINKDILDEISENDIFLTYNETNEDCVFELVGNLILFTKNPEYYIENRLSIVNNSKYNYEIIKILNY